MTNRALYPEGHDQAADAHLAAVAQIQNESAIREAIKRSKFQALRAALTIAGAPPHVMDAYCSAQSVASRSPFSGYASQKWAEMVDVVETWLTLQPIAAVCNVESADRAATEFELLGQVKRELIPTADDVRQDIADQDLIARAIAAQSTVQRLA